MARKVVISTQHNSGRNPEIISLRCPYCGHEGSFEGVGVQDAYGTSFTDGRNDGYFLGIRRCPRPECHGAVLYQQIGNEVVTYPAQRIDFDATDIPDSVSKCLREAIDCQANGDNTAAAIMVRKTLEEMCAQQGAKGKDLKDRIKDLGSKIVLPQELLKGMDTLRVLGNDAAHIEARVFTEIGPKELEVAIKFTKELLKNTYQYGSLLKELQDLASPTATTAPAP